MRVRMGRSWLTMMETTPTCPNRVRSELDLLASLEDQADHRLVAGRIDLRRAISPHHGESVDAGGHNLAVF